MQGHGSLELVNLFTDSIDSAETVTGSLRVEDDIDEEDLRHQLRFLGLTPARLLVKWRFVNS